jgi:hypothetical protein
LTTYPNKRKKKKKPKAQIKTIKSIGEKYYKIE